MRWCLVVFGALALGCAGFGGDPAEGLPEVPVVPVEGEPTDDDTGDAVADGTGDTGLPEAQPEPRRKARKGKVRRVRPPLTDPDPIRPPRDPKPKPKAKKPAPAPPPMAAGIEQVGETRWRVTRSLVKQWQDDPYELGNAREKDPGWELLGIKVRQASYLGMKNKDLLLTVNGHKLNTKAQLLSAYLLCKNDKRFDVVFQRAGQTMVHHYEIVE